MITELTHESLGKEANAALFTALFDMIPRQNNNEVSVVNYANPLSLDYLRVVDAVLAVRAKQGIAQNWTLSRWSCGSHKTKNTQGMFLNILVINRDGTTDFYWLLN